MCTLIATVAAIAKRTAPGPSCRSAQNLTRTMSSALRLTSVDPQRTAGTCPNPIVKAAWRSVFHYTRRKWAPLWVGTQRATTTTRTVITRSMVVIASQGLLSQSQMTLPTAQPLTASLTKDRTSPRPTPATPLIRQPDACYSTTLLSQMMQSSSRRRTSASGATVL